MDKVTIAIFTDPMMGLSYESEPVFRKLETHYGNRIAFQYIMSGLVRDVSDFMNAEELSCTPEEGIQKYCHRLAQIYKQEESISGMPIRMEGFHLFDAEHRSSYPLNIAYEAAKLADKDKAECFLYNLRYATIVETRQTTCWEEMLKVVEETGIDKLLFEKYYTDGSAKEEFRKDLLYRSSFTIYTLPSYLVQYQRKTLLIRSLADYGVFVQAINHLTNKRILPCPPQVTKEQLRNLIRKHPRISMMELKTAFTPDSMETLLRLLHELEKENTIIRKDEFVLFNP